MTAPDLINHPPHYISASGIEAIEVMERYELGLHLGSAMKYLLRANRKGRRVEDLKKARWYLQRWCHRYLEGLENEPLPDSEFSLCWQAPEQIADAFGLEGDHRKVAIAVLELAVFSDERNPAIRIGDAIAHLDRAIAAAASAED